MSIRADEQPLPHSRGDREKAGLPDSKLRSWREDARIFARQCCKVEPDAWQDLFLAAVSGVHIDPDAKRMLALKACKGPGKSFVLAVAGWWFLFTRWHANGIAMSITEKNLKDCLWTEMARVQERSNLLQHFFAHKGERIECKRYPKDWWLSARSFPQDADKQAQERTIAGIHGRHPFAICDEVGDYPDGVIVAVEAILFSLVDGKPPDGRVMLAGNPTSTEGPLYRITKRDRARWWVYEISSDPADPNRTPRVDPVEAQAAIDTWGRDSDYVKVNILGQFPSQQANKLIGPDLALEAARRPVPDGYEQDALVFGYDVARYGDNACVLFARQGKMSWKPLVWRELDTMTQADRLAEEWEERRPDQFFLDQTGVGGGVVDRLRQMGIPVIPIDFGGTPIDARFQDRRSEMYWRMSDWLKKGGVIPDDVGLRQELVSPRFEYRQTGRITKFKLESKDEMRKRGIQSPDMSDALALTFSMEVQAHRGRRPETHKQENTRSALDHLRLRESGPEMDAVAHLGLPGPQDRSFGSGKIKGGTDDDYNPFGGG
jgi:hypothetical protein